MKAHWDEAKGTTDQGQRTTDSKDQRSELEWLPPFTEWDFRTIKERESRLACCWEYARNTPAICENLTGWIDGPGGLTVLGNFICREGVRFPEPWVLGGDDLRCASELLEPDEEPITVFSTAEREAYLLQELERAQQEGRDVVAAARRLLLGEGVSIVFNFRAGGTEAVVKALGQMGRAEAKNHPRVRRGKAAAPPFEWMKWLAALRLEAARQEAGMSFGEVQSALLKHQKEFPIVQASPTLPIYSGHPAWSKAISDARNALTLLQRDPRAFEERILLS